MSSLDDGQGLMEKEMSHSLFAPFSHPSFPLSYSTQPPLLSPCTYALGLFLNNMNNKEIGEDTKERKPIISSGQQLPTSRL